MAPEPGGHRRPFLARRIAAEPTYRRRVETADRLGIPGTQLDGREPATVTEYEYEDGRLVRSVTTSESRWTDMDRAEVLALAMHRAGLCPLCGQPLAVCTADEKAGAPEMVAEYTACRSTLARLEHQRGLTDHGKKDDPYAPARLWAFSTRGGNG